MAQMALALSRLFSKRFRINYSGLTSIVGECHLHTDKDFSSAISTSKVQDVLLSNIRNANNSNELFNVISQHNQVFNQKHVMQALSSMHEIYKAKNHKGPPADVINDPSFERLCVQLKKFSRSLDMYETIDAIKVLAFMNVPANSTVFQMLLQLVRQNINQLNIQQIMFLDFVLGRCENNHLIDALKLAMPLVFQLNVSMQVDDQDVTQLAALLRYCSTNSIPQKLVTRLVTSAALNDSGFSKDTAKSLLWSLSELRCPVDQSGKAYRNLLKKCFNVMTKQINGFHSLDVLKTVLKLKFKILANHLDFYDEDFLNACGNYAVKKHVDLYDALRLAKNFSRIAFTHLPLLEYLSEIIMDDPDTLSDCRPSVLFHFVNILSNANYQPENWDIIQGKIFANPILKVGNTKLPWTKFAVELASLDTYNDDLLNTVFSEAFLEKYMGREKSYLDHIQLLTLNQCVMLFHKSYDGIRPPTEYVKRAIEIIGEKSIDHSLWLCLTKGLGGAQYVAPAVIMPNGYFVDFVTAFRDGHPIAINLGNTENGPIRYEDLEINKNCEVVCIVSFQVGCYSLNCSRLRGNYNLSLKIIEAMGYQVVPVSSAQLANTPDAEKIPYIMQEISYKSCKSPHLNAVKDMT